MEVDKDQDQDQVEMDKDQGRQAILIAKLLATQKLLLIILSTV